MHPALAICPLFAAESSVWVQVEFTAQLDLRRYTAPDAETTSYALTGIVVHLGETATSGHYTAFAKTGGNPA